MSRTLLITGATGKQGGSVIDNLINQDADFEILAVTRDAQSNGAQKLLKKSSNIKLVEGNLDHPEDIFRQAQKVTTQPIWGVFSVQTPVPGLFKEDSEERQGKALVDSALNNNVKVFVYTSVDRGGDASIDNPTPVPHFIHKHNIEHHLINQSKGADMQWTILRPVAFLNNFTPDFLGSVFATSWKIALRGKPLQLISVTDIGFFGAQAFLYPHEYKNRPLSLAGDELTYDEMARIFKRVTGEDCPLTNGFLARLLMWAFKELGVMFRWFYDSGYKADIPALRRVHPGLKNFEAWLETESGFLSK
ncbi:nucleoside-diphosphate-sugar epimerase family protein [Aspergillus pseudotamarii]|uniref:Nucleoside-diphosphate-sugar epimerase family protein n=1 Tax=Aspergillus pseudotamarii TaxID=132259 RepID=A0A5N6SZG2_ASPPS|nr:nucleoside-diphosphate-sugar epimerase family protein [Aspergillus pseudotamarii]KAE8140078.1 nucleoside-diphosphate-sugar epimerase family protein [Aspergillus pseudotamarii]